MEKLKWPKVSGVRIENIEMADGFEVFQTEILKWPEVSSSCHTYAPPSPKN
jgi:hypothetical protein